MNISYFFFMMFCFAMSLIFICCLYFVIKMVYNFYDDYQIDIDDDYFNTDVESDHNVDNKTATFFNK